METNDIDRLTTAVRLLENPSWTAKITDIIGTPVEWAVKKLPKMADHLISDTTTKAIKEALKVAIVTMKAGHKGSPKRWLHKGAVAATGAAGGFFGLAGLPVELPGSTVIMLRSIADIARSEGEDITEIETQLNCISVFALGSKKKNDDNSSEAGYYAIRAFLGKLITETSGFIAKKGLVEEGAPIIVKFIVRIASMFEVVISEKVAAQSVPIIGAVSGAAINLLFINHFQSVATGHFIIRSLERKYGEELVKAEYSRIIKNL